MKGGRLAQTRKPHEQGTTIAAKVARCHPETIRRAAARGRIQATQTPGGHLRVDIKALREVIKVGPK
jgi:excisionase family DNA binding protein